MVAGHVPSFSDACAFCFDVYSIEIYRVCLLKASRGCIHPQVININVIPFANSTRLIHFLFNTDYFINGYVMMLGLIHPFLTARSLEIFSCASDGPVKYMIYNQTEECYTSGWYSKMPVALLGEPSFSLLLIL
jgi:hypothetical protein